MFKTIADPFVGKMSFFKVMSGELYSDAALKNLTNGQSERLSHIYTICGKKQTEVPMLSMGDLGMTAKLAATNTNDTLSASEEPHAFKKIVYPESFYQMAVSPKAKGDEDKISQGISKLLEEDLTLKYENNPETKQLLLSGQGDIHLDVVVSRLKSRFGTSVELSPPKIAYRETIKKKVEVGGQAQKAVRRTRPIRPCQDHVLAGHAAGTGIHAVRRRRFGAETIIPLWKRAFWRRCRRACSQAIPSSI